MFSMISAERGGVTRNGSKHVRETILKNWYNGVCLLPSKRSAPKSLDFGPKCVCGYSYSLFDIVFNT